MKRIFNSVVSLAGVYLFLVFFSSQLPHERPDKSNPAKLNLKEIAEKVEQKPQGAAAPASGYTQSQLAAAGQAYQRSAGGASEGDMPRINGVADDYLEYSRVSNAKLLVYSPGLKQYLGELEAGNVPTIVPLEFERLKSDYPAEGRLVKNPGLLAMASDAAARKGRRGSVRLYMVLPSQQHYYLLGKLVATLRGEGLALKDVASVDARYLVRGGSAQIVFVSALLKNGKSVQLKEMEVTV